MPAQNTVKMAYRHLLFSKMKNVSTNKLIEYHSRNGLPFNSKVKHLIGIDHEFSNYTIVYVKHVKSTLKCNCLMFVFQSNIIKQTY